MRDKKKFAAHIAEVKDGAVYADYFKELYVGCDTTELASQAKVCYNDAEAFNRVVGTFALKQYKKVDDWNNILYIDHKKLELVNIADTNDSNILSLGLRFTPKLARKKDTQAIADGYVNVLMQGFNMKPLYMWAGGKNKMIPKYIDTPNIPKTGYDTFVEPFFGGGAMTIWIYKNCPDVKHFVINDVKQELVGIYEAIKTDHKLFLKEMDRLSVLYLPLDKENRRKFYYNLREKYTTDWSSNPTIESATLYFLMKTAFNGIWQTTQAAKGSYATPCGLLNQKDSVYDKDNVIEWHKFLQSAKLHCGDWQKACSNVKGNAFYFMDPPYRDSFTSYGSSFDDTEHSLLIDFCKQKDREGHLIFYCNRDDSNDGFFDINQGHLSAQNYNIKYTAGRRKTNDDGTKSAKAASEILLYSSRLAPVTLCQELGMFTIEFDQDETSITLLDSTGELEDVNILLYDDYCHIRQWNNTIKYWEIVTLTSEMYLALMKAWQLPEGSYVMDMRTKASPDYQPTTKDQ